VTGAGRDPDLAVRLHAPDARPVTGARVDHDDWRLRGIDGGAFWRKDADEPVVDRALELAPVENKLNREVENIRDILRRLREWMFPRSFKASSGERSAARRSSNMLSLGRAS
jgi:hypothetical protein